MSELASDAQLADLGRLAIDRCRKAFMSVGQLVEDDAQRSAMLVACAVDMIKGAATMLENDGIPADAACEVTVTAALTALDIAFEMRKEKVLMIEIITTALSNAHAKGVLAMWTVFNRPVDHPQGYIARCFEYDQPTDIVVTGELSELRNSLERCGLVCLHRNPEDHPSVVETWI